jgi:hypothetical protein
MGVEKLKIQRFGSLKSGYLRSTRDCHEGMESAYDSDSHRGDPDNIIDRSRDTALAVIGSAVLALCFTSCPVAQ